MDNKNNIRRIECKTSYLEDMVRYSIIINRRRSIPDRKDGLKPVQRRILWDMYDHSHAISESSKVKCAAIVGSTMELYHPHGESIYGSIPLMAQPFLKKIPLVNSKSNFGTIMGDGPAASRYTEAWLSKFAIENVIGALSVSREVVDMSPAFTNKTTEPDYLPVKVPLLLINGASGIGLGMKVDIPTHNLNEVIDATLRLMDNPNADVVLIPDHCLPCNIIDTNWKAICNKGNGKYRARGIIDISEDKSGRPIITIKSLPNNVFTNVIVKQVNDLIVKNRFPQISDIDDASKKTVNIIITLKKGSDAQFVREALYKYTDCESTYSVNFEVIDGVNPIRMSYKSYLQSFIDFAMANKFREYCNEMQRVKTRYHQLDAYIKVLKSGEIDNIIKMIKKQSSIDDNYLIEYLIKKIGLTDLQATFIINANIKQLSIGYLKKYEDEAKKLSALEKEYVQKIIDDSFIKDEVRNDLIEAKNRYGAPRVCKVIKVSDDSNVPKGTFKLVVTENNYIRKIGENDPVNIVRGDIPNFVMKVDNTENILLFDNKGKVFKLPIHKLPIMARSDMGLDVRGIIKGLTADIIAILYEPGIKQLARLKTKYYVTIVSENNCIKKLDIEDFLTVPPSGIIYTKLNDGDSVKDIQVIADNLDAIIYSGHKALRVSSKDIPNYKRNTLGVSAMNIRGAEKIEGLSVIYPDSTDVVVITKSGKLNKFNISGLGVDKRNKSGASVIKLSSGDSIKSIYGVSDKDIIHIVTTAETMDVPVSSIQSTSSISSGIKIVATKTDKIIKVEIIKPEKK